MQSPVVILEILSVSRDARGCIFEPLAPDALALQGNVHVVVTEAGAIRGNHYHRRGMEVLIVQGPALVRTKHGPDVSDTRVPEGEVYRFTIPPGISHAIQNTGSRPTIMVAFNSEIHNPANPDMVRHIILEA